MAPPSKAVLVTGRSSGVGRPIAAIGDPLRFDVVLIAPGFRRFVRQAADGG